MLPTRETDACGKASEVVRLVADEVMPLLADEAERWMLVQHEKLPDFRAYGDVRDVSRTSTESYFRLLTGIIREGLDPSEAAPPPEGVRAAREYARLGLPLTSLLRAFRLGHANIWSFWFERLRRATDDAEVLAEAVAYVSDAMFAFVDSVVTQVAEEYSAEREQWFRSDAAARLEAIRMLLEDGGAGTAELGRTLGYALDRDHVALVLWANPDDPDRDAAELQRSARQLLAALAPAAGLAVPLGHFTVAAWAPTGRTDAAATLARIERRRGVSVAVGEPGHGVEGFRRSHEEAEDARRVARLVGRPAGSLVSYREVSFVALATADAEHARRFVERELGPLAADDDSALKLRATLAVYFDAGSSLTETARRIGIHQNTVAYRLNRAAELLGRPLDERLLELRAALALVGAVAPS